MAGTRETIAPSLPIALRLSIAQVEKLAEAA